MQLRGDMGMLIQREEAEKMSLGVFVTESKIERRVIRVSTVNRWCANRLGWERDGAYCVMCTYSCDDSFADFICL